MSIVLEIKDGPPPGYMSDRIRVRGTPSASAPVITPVGSTPTKTSDNWIFVEVNNNGTEDAIGCQCDKLGAFVSAQVIAPGGGDVSGSQFFSQATGGSPSGTSVVDHTVNTQIGQHYVTLRTAAGAQLQQLSFMSNEMAGWGFSPDGRYFIFVHRVNLGGTLSYFMSVVTAEQVGTSNPGSNRISQQNTSWVTGGFNPDSTAFLAQTQTGGVTLFDWSGGSNSTFASLSSNQWAQVRFSPCGDVCAVLPSAGNSAVKFYRRSGTGWASWAPTQQTKPIATVTVTGPNPTFSVVNQTGLGIQLGNMSTPAIDNPTCMFPTGLVKVDVWAYPSSTYITRDPNHRVGSGYVDIRAGQSREAMIGPWRPMYVAPPNHYCVFAEAGTLDSRDPAPPQTASFDIVQRRQVAQRNVVVLAPSSPQFVFAFLVVNDSDEAQDSSIRVAPVDGRSSDVREDPLLGALPERSFKSTRMGLARYSAGDDLGAADLRRQLELSLRPHETAQLVLWFDNPEPEVEAAQVFRIEEFRDGEVVGGIVVAGHTFGDDFVGLALAEFDDPSPIDFDGDISTFLGSHIPTQGVLYQSLIGQRLQAEFINNSQQDLQEATVYLESASCGVAGIEPLRLSVGDLAPGDSMIGTWRINPGTTPPGEYLASFIVEDAAHSYKRIMAPFKVLAEIPNDLHVEVEGTVYTFDPVMMSIASPVAGIDF